MNAAGRAVRRHPPEVSGEGPVLVLHPGMFQTGAHWDATGYAARLRADHTVVAVDPLGLGAGDAPHDPAAYALERRVGHVTAVLGMALHAPERCTAVVAGAWDPADGLASALAATLRQLGLPADTDAFALLRQGAYADPAQAAVIDAAGPAALRADYAAFWRDRGLDAGLAAGGVPTLMYRGTADPWHGPMRAAAARVRAAFFSVPDAGHRAGWERSADVLPGVLPFLAARVPGQVRGRRPPSRGGRRPRRGRGGRRPGPRRCRPT
ncbi:alpha/beta fold hydrolase [Streptomyces sp. MS19]|uniref:alpha/beta fold hydrolase n=1 Tax=Streptomyces sp. MS19 TaxID=3385972 RepID=UPI0039A128A5